MSEQAAGYGNDGTEKRIEPNPEILSPHSTDTPIGVTALVLRKRHVLVIARPHPLSMEKVSASVPHGLSVAEIVGSEAKNCRIEIGGVVVPEFWWRHVRPHEGTVVYVTRFPAGGGGGGWKMIFRLIAFAALAALTYGIATPGLIQGLLPEFIQALSAGASFAVAAGVGIAGSLLINALIPPAATGVGQATSPTMLQGITGVQNAADPYGAITCVFGTMLVFPKLAAQSRTELSGDSQYLRCLFDLGYGDTNQAALQIGTDDLANFTDVEYQIAQNPTIFTQDIEEVAAGDEMDDDGDAATHTTAANADECSLDLIFPSGLVAVDSDGNPETATCQLSIRFQPINVTGPPTSGPVASIAVVNTGRYRNHITATVNIVGDGVGATATAVIGTVGNQGGMPLWGVLQIVMGSGGTGYTHATASLNITSGADGSDQSASLGAVQLSLTGGTWVNAMSAAGLTISNYSARSDGTYLNASSSAQQSLRIGVRWKFPVNGQYNVQVARIVSDYQGTTDNQHSGNMVWTIIRTIRYGSPSTTPTTKVALRIKATDQLNGTISQFNLLLSQVIPVWTGSSWVNEQSSNPAWIYRWLLRDCPANPKRVDAARINDDDLKEWAVECDTKGFSFNYTNDQVTTVFELLRIICACGRASFNVVDGKYTVVRDLFQVTPVQIFTPRNTAEFQGTRAFVDVVHALRVQFINPEAGYQQDEVVVYDDGYDATNATVFEQLQMPGCADAAMAWKLGRYHLAVARLRPNAYSWTTDVEHLICNRGDLVYFASDVISVGLGWGRVKSITLDGSGNVVSVTVDEPQTITDGAPTYAMRFRCQDGTAKISVVTFELGNAVTEFALTMPTPGISPGDLFLFGIEGLDSIPMLVSKIEPAADLAAKITAVDAAPQVLNADLGYIDSTATYHAGVPTLTSSITGQAWLEPPPPPQFLLISSSSTLSSTDDQGVTSAVMVITVG